MKKRTFTLKEAEYFLDQGIWKRFLELCKTHENALHTLWSPGPRISNFVTPDDPIDKLKRQLREQLLGSFKQQILNGQVIAQGYNPASTRLETIPAAYWNHFSINFLENYVTGDKYKFIGIQLSKRGETAVVEDIISECTEWILITREARGEIFKKTLQNEAMNYFGTRLKTRDFDAAYTRAFNRKRGRPKRAKK